MERQSGKKCRDRQTVRQPVGPPIPQGRDRHEQTHANDENYLRQIHGAPRALPSPSLVDGEEIIEEHPLLAGRAGTVNYLPLTDLPFS
jgi:hypothetical protein